MSALAAEAVVIADPPAVTRDVDDDYLLALAAAGRADLIVFGDYDLTDLGNPALPVLRPREF